MKNSTHIITIALCSILIACSKNKSPQPIPTPLPPVVNQTVINISVDVNNVVRTLTGNEVGINLNYLMDDAIIDKNNYNKTADGLQQMGVKVLRYPGGEKSDNYYFASPPYTSASPSAITCLFPIKNGNNRFINADYTAKSEVLDFDEFMQVCSKIGAKPLIVVAYDAMYMNNTWCNGTRPTKAQLIENAKQWVKYANITKKHGIKLWMIGNESFYDKGSGFTTAAQYANDIVEFADAMRSVDASIKIIANGTANWWPTLLSSPAAAAIDYLAVSNYLPAAVSSYDKYITNNGSLNGETDQAIASINNIALGQNKARIGVIESEYNSIDFSTGTWESVNNLGHALCSFQMLADGLLKPKLFNACFWNTRWVDNVTAPQHLYDALQANGSLNANGTSLSILGNNLLATMVNSTATGSVKSYASYSSTNNNLRLFLLNKGNTAQKVKISLANYLSTFTFDKWEFKGNGADDKYPTWAAVATNQAGGLTVEITLPATSVTVLACK
jgi:alpha-L-arabinofuranosidase